MTRFDPEILLAGVLYDGRYAADGLIAGVANRLQQRGWRLAGVVQANETYDPLCPCDMQLVDLSGGASLRISQRLGQHARGCRLDPDALSRAVAMTETALPGADMLIVNKFGKAEAAGYGFRPVIAEALANGTPVLAGVSQTNLAAFNAFAAGMGVMLPAEAKEIERWIEGHGIRGAAVA
ncbi:MAG: DUF2478 domain-containing protein [Proteobacteria bacterium]|nr:DUF2478 domain-containing protein [Pseudomonadota bacterium]